MLKNILCRLNELAKKAHPLTLNEINERHTLRQLYLAEFRAQFKNNLLTVTVLDPHGNDVTPAKLRQAQQQIGVKI